MNWTYTYLALCCSFILTVSSSFSYSQLDSARNAYKAKRYDKALYFYKKAVRNTPTEQVKKELAQASYRAKQYNEALRHYRSNKSKDKRSRAANMYNIGNAYFQQKQYKKAIQYYKKSLRIQPNNIKAQYNLSEAIRKLNNNKPKKDPKKKDNKPKNDKNNSNKNNKSQKKPDAPGSSNEMNKNSVERLLDQLMKAEAKTKRKINANRSANSGKSSTGKDW
jgi:Ca-activated chloride channel family protein